MLSSERGGKEVNATNDRLMRNFQGIDNVLFLKLASGTKMFILFFFKDYICHTCFFVYMLDFIKIITINIIYSIKSFLGTYYVPDIFWALWTKTHSCPHRAYILAEKDDRKQNPEWMNENVCTFLFKKLKVEQRKGYQECRADCTIKYSLNLTWDV